MVEIYQFVKHITNSYVERVFKSWIPLLKFSYENYAVDLTCNNLMGIHNSWLLLAYWTFDQRAHILIKCLKYHLKQQGVIDGAAWYLTSYALCLMVIAFLQEKKVLPNLQEGVEDNIIEVPVWDFRKNVKKFSKRNVGFHTP